MTDEVPTPDSQDTSEQCIRCGCRMRPEHAHYKCENCGCRDACCEGVY